MGVGWGEGVDLGSPRIGSHSTVVKGVGLGARLPHGIPALPFPPSVAWAPPLCAQKKTARVVITAPFPCTARTAAEC